MSIGSLYQYFPNKDAIVVSLMQAHVEATSQVIGERLADGFGGELAGALRGFIRAMIDIHRDDPGLHRVLFEEAPRSPAFLAQVHESEQAIVDAAARLLELHPEVAVGDHRMAAQIVVAAIESLVHRLITMPFPVDPQHLEDEIVTLLAGYLRGTDNADNPRETPSQRCDDSTGFAELNHRAADV